MSATPYLIPAIRALAPAVSITLPGSKSIALRQLAMASLATGSTCIRGIPPCDDTDAMLDCIRVLGAGVIIEPDTITVTGPISFTTDVHLDARMSGASTRLLIGIAALRSGTTHIDGHESLRARTNAPLLKVLANHGCQVESTNGHLPTTIRGPLQPPAELVIDGSLSSQYVTALLLCVPVCAASEVQNIRIVGDLVSRPYIDITLNEMSKRGVHARWIDDTRLEVERAEYQTGNVQVEGDATAATYFAALATLHGASIELTNLGASTHQGDYDFLQVMEQLGAKVERHPNSTRIEGPENLEALAETNMNSMPDAALTLIALAPLLPGRSKITGLSSLHHKECDRLECPATEFHDLGISAHTTHDSIEIDAVDVDAIQAHTLRTYHDHRMAMAFSLLGSVSGTLTVDDQAVVNKTYPNYWQDYAKIRSASTS